jgi:hypothetical protein
LFIKIVISDNYSIHIKNFNFMQSMIPCNVRVFIKKPILLDYFATSIIYNHLKAPSMTYPKNE